MDEIVATGHYDGVRGGLPRRRGLHRRGKATSCLGRRTEATPGPVERLHRPGDLLPLDPARTGARRDRLDDRTTTCGAGTPTGSGVPRRSGRSTRIVRRFWPRRSSRAVTSYAELMRLERPASTSATRLERLKGRPRRERVDPGRRRSPIERTRRVPAVVRWRTCRSTPIWLCPLRLRDRRGGGRSTRSGRTGRLRQRRLLVDACRSRRRPRAATSTA